MTETRTAGLIRFQAGRVQGPMPRRKDFMLETYAQMAYVAKLLERVGYKYIIGWKDVRGWGVYGVRNVEWIKPNEPAYCNLRID